MELCELFTGNKVWFDIDFVLYRMLTEKSGLDIWTVISETSPRSRQDLEWKQESIIKDISAEHQEFLLNIS